MRSFECERRNTSVVCIFRSSLTTRAFMMPLRLVAYHVGLSSCSCVSGAALLLHFHHTPKVQLADAVCHSLCVQRRYWTPLFLQMPSRLDSVTNAPTRSLSKLMPAFPLECDRVTAGCALFRHQLASPRATINSDEDLSCDSLCYSCFNFDALHQQGMQRTDPGSKISRRCSGRQ